MLFMSVYDVCVCVCAGIWLSVISSGYVCFKYENTQHDLPLLMIMLMMLLPVCVIDDDAGCRLPAAGRVLKQFEVLAMSVR